MLFFFAIVSEFKYVPLTNTINYVVLTEKFTRIVTFLRRNICMTENKNKGKAELTFPQMRN